MMGFSVNGNGVHDRTNDQDKDCFLNSYVGSHLS